MLMSMLMLAHALISVFLVILVLLQRSEGGLGAMGGGAGSLVGGSSAANGMEKATKYMFVLFVLTSLALSMLANGRGAHTSVLETETVTPQESGLLVMPPKKEVLKLLPAAPDAAE